MEYYDRIISNHAIINIRKHGVLENICKLHCKAYDKMKYKNQIQNQILELTYTSTDDVVLHGAGQGTGNGGTHWILIGSLFSTDKIQTLCRSFTGDVI